MTDVHYDPGVKHYLKHQIYELLYKPSADKMKFKLDTIINRNTLIGKYTHKSFTYKGVSYSSEPTAPPRKSNSLIPELKGDMDDYLTELEALNGYEVPYVLGFITAVLNASNHFPDYLKILPEIAHKPVKESMNKHPWKSEELTDQAVEEFKEKFKVPIQLMKQRVIKNMIT